MSISASIWDEVDEMPKTFEGKKALSESFLRRALQGLLIESRKRNVLTEPYGRPVQPTPLLNLSEFLNSGGLDEPSDGTVNDDPVFSYDYGFDPLQYLANYLKFLHPTHIRSMKDERIAIVDRLRFQAAHAINVLDECEELKILTKKLRSGILWGPFTSPSTSSSSSLSAVICACRVVKEGDLIIQISKDSAFSVIENTWTQAVTDKNMTQKLLLSELYPGTKYFVRCCLSDVPRGDLTLPPVGPDLVTPSPGPGLLSLDIDTDSDLNMIAAVDNRCFQGVSEGYFQTTEFISCPSDEETVVEGFQGLAPTARVDAVTIVALTVSSYHLTADSLKIGSESRMSNNGNDYFISCLLGDVFSVPVAEGGRGDIHRSCSGGDSSVMDYTDWYKQKSFDMHRSSDSLVRPDSILRNSSMLLAWHDRSQGSDVRLNDEETALKQFASDMKRYQSKYGKGKGGKLKQRSSGAPPEAIPPLPKLKKLRMTPELAEVLQTFPLDLEPISRSDVVEDPTMRQLYSTSMLGPYVQIFVLDYRRGYLGKDQVLWLTEALTNSTARFKIIMAGTPFGVSTEGSVTVAKSRDSVTKVCTEAISGREKEREGSSGTVSMLIPPPVAALGWDESGRLNLSLPAVIAAYQLLCIKRNSDKRDEMESRQSNSEEVSTAQRMDLGSERDSCDMNIDIVGSQRSDAFEESNIPSPHSAQTDIESGILILSAGACIPLALGKPGEATAVSEVTSALEQKRKSLSNSNDSLDKRRPPLALSSSRSGSLRTLSVLKGLEGDLIEWNKEDSNVSPFAAVYDPCGSGKPICFEVSVGSCGDNGEERSLTGVIPSLSPALPPVLLPYLGGKLLYTTPVRVPLENSGGRSLDTFSAVVSLSEDGYSLDLRLLLFQPDQEHSVLFKHRLRIPH